MSNQKTRDEDRNGSIPKNIYAELTSELYQISKRAEQVFTEDTDFPKGITEPISLIRHGEELEELRTPTAKAIELDKELLMIFGNLRADRTAGVLKTNLEVLISKFRSKLEVEERLINVCRDLRSEEIDLSRKAQNTLKMREEFRSDFRIHRSEAEDHISMMTKQVEEALKVNERGKELSERLAESGTETETKTAQMEATLKQETEKKEREKSQLVTLTSIQQEKVLKLTKEVSELNEHIDLIDGKIENFNEEIKFLKSEVGANETKVQSLDIEKRKLEEKNIEIISNIETEKRTYVEMSGEKQRLDEQLVIIESQIASVQEEKQSKKDQISGLNSKYKTLKKDLEIVNEKKEKQESQLASFVKEFELRSHHLSTIEEGILAQQKKLSIITKMINNENMAHLKLVDDKETFDTILEEFKRENQIEIDKLNKADEAFQDEQKIKNDAKMYLKVRDEKVVGLRNKVIELQQEAKKLENQIQGSRNTARFIAKHIELVNAQEQKYSQEAEAQHAKFNQAIQEIKVKNYLIGDFQQRNKNLAKKLKQQQSLYQAVRSERDVYLKSLIDFRVENSELRQAFDSLKHKIVQLKEESKFKTSEILSLGKQQHVVIEDKDEIEQKRKQLQERINALEKQIHSYQQETSNLKILIAEGNIERKKRQNLQDCIVSERDLLSVQLFKRQKELSKVTDQIKSITTFMNIDEKNLQVSKENLEKAKVEFEEYENTLTNLKESVKAYFPIKMEVIALRREILRAMALNTAYERKLDVPVNVHRWRKLEATDPEKYEKILKIHHLQKLLISKSDELALSEKTIDNLEKEFFEQKNISARREKLQNTANKTDIAAIVKEKSMAIKQMVKSLEETNEGVRIKKLEIEMIDKKIDNLKKEYISQRFNEIGEIVVEDAEDVCIESLKKSKII